MFTTPFTASVVSVTTNAVAGTPTTTAILGAPGATSAYRIVALAIAIRRDVTGIIEVFWAQGAANFWSMAVGGGAAATAINGYADTVFPFPGYQLPVNTALNVTHTATVATQIFRASVAYYIDNVS